MFYNRHMKTYSPANTPNEDSIEYKMLNLTYCYWFDNQFKLDFTYIRNDTRINQKITFDQLESEYKGLGRVVTELADLSDPSSTELSELLSATCSYLFESCIDLTKVGFTDTEYPFITNLEAITFSIDKDYYIIKGCSFKLGPVGYSGIPLARLDPCPS